MKHGTVVKIDSLKIDFLNSAAKGSFPNDYKSVGIIVNEYNYSSEIVWTKPIENSRYQSSVITDNLLLEVDKIDNNSIKVNDSVILIYIDQTSNKKYIFSTCTVKEIDDTDKEDIMFKVELYDGKNCWVDEYWILSNNDYNKYFNNQFNEQPKQYGLLNKIYKALGR